MNQFVIRYGFTYIRNTSNSITFGQAAITNIFLHWTEKKSTSNIYVDVVVIVVVVFDVYQQYV